MGDTPNQGVKETRGPVRERGCTLNRVQAELKVEGLKVGALLNRTKQRGEMKMMLAF
jgi:hypothetical protein